MKTVFSDKLLNYFNSINSTQDTQIKTEKYDEPKMKKCSHCNQIKPRSEFYRDKYAKDGLQHWCKDCRQMEYQNREKNKKLILQAYSSIKTHYNDDKINIIVIPISQPMDKISEKKGFISWIKSLFKK